MNELQMTLGTYMLFKHCVQDETKEKRFSTFKITCPQFLQHTQKGQMCPSYIDILDAKSDSKDTLLPMLSDLKTDGL